MVLCISAFHFKLSFCTARACNWDVGESNLALPRSDWNFFHCLINNPDTQALCLLKKSVFEFTSYYCSLNCF